MPLKVSEAIVLRAHPLGESDRIVTFLTRNTGKIRGVAKGARRSRRRFGSSLELLSRVRLHYFEKERSSLVRIEATDLLESFYLIQEDPERGAVLACFAEIADAFAREQQEDEAFFRLLHAIVRAVRDGLHLDVALRYFELWTLRLHGVLPTIASCAACGGDLTQLGGRYDRRESVVTCASCRPERAPGDLSLPSPAVRAAGTIMKQAPGALIGQTMEVRALRSLAALTQAMLVELTERKFRSYDVLQRVRAHE